MNQEYIDDPYLKTSLETVTLASARSKTENQNSIKKKSKKKSQFKEGTNAGQ